MSVAHETLPLSIGEVQRTRLPLERATPLPQAAFTDPRVLDWEVEHIFMREWVCVGHVDQVRERGDYLMVELGDESVFVVADDDGLPHAFRNTLPPPRRAPRRGPRGPASRASSARTTPGPTASTARCAARRTPTRSRTSTRAATACSPSACAVVEGLVLIDLSGDGAVARRARRRRRRPHWRATGYADLRRGARIVYDVDANWKAIAENYSECLHCPGVHPELNQLSHYLSGETLTGAGRVVRRLDDLARGRRDDGERTAATAARRSTGLTEDDLRSSSTTCVFPNTLVSLHPDYVMLHTLWPRAERPHRGRLRVVLRARDHGARRTSTRATRSSSGTRSTARTGASARLTQRGMASRATTMPGRYTSEETDVHEFDVMVADRYMEALAASEEVVPMSTNGSSRNGHRTSTRSSSAAATTASPPPRTWRAPACASASSSAASCSAAPA